MTNRSDNQPYSPEIVEFLTVAVQTCIYVEQELPVADKRRFVETMLKLLPVLYVKALLVPSFDEPDDFGFLEQFCSEDDYNRVFNSVRAILQTDDSYIAVAVEDGRYCDMSDTRSIAEDIADIYQELKNMAANYQSHAEDVMMLAVAECLEAFREHWGLKLLDALRALHILSLDPDFLSQDED